MDVKEFKKLPIRTILIDWDEGLMHFVYVKVSNKKILCVGDSYANIADHTSLSSPGDHFNLYGCEIAPDWIQELYAVK